jgi:hypothetical protein
VTRPIFLLSLPRSGSTLVQRILAGHADIATSPEPWILLPQVYAMRERGVYAEYGQTPASRAIREFAERLPGGTEDYEAELRAFVSRLYERASGGTRTYFLDKTPRYHHIVEDLFRLFPDGKFVFLWRNPLSIAASISETWGRGRWNVEKYRDDLYGAVEHLVAARGSHPTRSVGVRFEDLVTSSPGSWERLFDHLELEFDPEILTSFDSVKLQARMGDPTGSRTYRTLSTEPLDKWKQTLSNPIRKRWCRSYLEWIGQPRLAAMGYELKDLLSELDDVPSSRRRLASDLAAMAYGRVRRVRRRATARTLWGGNGSGA